MGLAGIFRSCFIWDGCGDCSGLGCRDGGESDSLVECWGERECSNQPPRFDFVSCFIFRGSEAFALDGEEVGGWGGSKLRRHWAWSEIALLYFVILFHSRMVSNLVCA